MLKKTFKQKIHVKSILGNIGVFLYVPAVMALISVSISIIFKEYYAIIPLVSIAIINLIIAQLLFKFFYDPKKIRLWDAMISVAIGWLLCPLFGALPYFFISKIAISSGIESSSCLILSNFLNSTFESFSGFTSSGLTMLKLPADLPKTMQWLRSFQQWVGGVGLIIFVLSLIEPKREEYQLYFAETKSKNFKKSLIKTSRAILLVYLIYTLLGILAFSLAKMPLWASINHSLAGISTGGFTITDDSFENYSSPIKWIAIGMMIFGAMSFSLHYKMIIERKFTEFWENVQNRVFYILLAIGSVLLILFNLEKIPYIDSVFSWVSSLGTCGFHVKKISTLSSPTKLLMIVAMIIGGCSGSTVGGLKIRRVIFLFQALILRLKSFTIFREKKVLKRQRISGQQEPSGVTLPESHKTERLYEASVLFFVWMITLFVGFFLVILCEKDKSAIDIFFDTVSALSNVGLTTGITTANLSNMGKIVFTIVMWLGRLEIIPILVLLISFFIPFEKKSKKNF